MESSRNWMVTYSGLDSRALSRGGKHMISALRLHVAAGSSAWLCRCFSWQHPSWEYQHSRMTLERARQNLGSLHTQANSVVLDGRKGGLGNPRALRQLILAQALELPNNAHRLPDRHCNTLPRWTISPHVTASGSHVA